MSDEETFWDVGMDRVPFMVGVEYWIGISAFGSSQEVNSIKAIQTKQNTINNFDFIFSPTNIQS